MKDGGVLFKLICVVWWLRCTKTRVVVNITVASRNRIIYSSRYITVYERKTDIFIVVVVRSTLGRFSLGLTQRRYDVIMFLSSWRQKSPPSPASTRDNIIYCYWKCVRHRPTATVRTRETLADVATVCLRSKIYLL